MSGWNYIRIHVFSLIYCVRACVRACVRVCVCVRACVVRPYGPTHISLHACKSPAGHSSP